MELWVRSQNKCKLRKTDLINYSYEAGKHIIDCHGYPVGTYASKKRCLEIIDEIQKLLFCDFITVNTHSEITIEDLEEKIKRNGAIMHFPKEPLVEYHGASTVVYEMPEE